MSNSYQAKQPVDRLAPGGVAGRVTGTLDGALMAMLQANAAMLTANVGGGRGVTRIVAASNAAASTYTKADYICDGTADQVEINAALASLGSTGGTVLLSEGTFTLAGPISTTGAKQTLQGMGMGATTLVVVNAGGAPINVPLVALAHDATRLCDLTVDGNKAQNAAQTAMVGVAVSGVAKPSVQRVRMVNSAGLGITTDALIQNGVVRDCLVETAAATGYRLRAAALQRLVVSGCTAKGNSGVGFLADNGPVAISSSQALTSGSYGFQASGTAQANLVQCTAQSSAAQGFMISAADARLSACRSIASVIAGFETSGARTAFTGCEAYGTTGAGHGLHTAVGATDTMVNGCASTSNVNGFTHASAGRGQYVGCRALANTQHAVHVTNGSATIRHCYLSGVATASRGVYMSAGTDHVIDGCRIVNFGCEGIWGMGTATRVQITNNYVSDVSLLTHQTYHMILLEIDDCFIHGNTMRNPASGNMSAWGVVIGNAAENCFIGYNDVVGMAGGEVYDVGINTRRMVRLALDFVSAADINVSVPAYTWTDACPNQTFRVGSSRSLIEIACRGFILVGGSPNTTEVSTRLVIDAGGTPQYRYLGMESLEVSGYHQNALGGAGPIKFSDLAVGNHTVKLQVHASQSGANVLIRAASYFEHLAIQVTEFARL